MGHYMSIGADRGGGGHAIYLTTKLKEIFKSKRKEISLYQIW
jgi:hypothetical protein